MATISRGGGEFRSFRRLPGSRGLSGDTLVSFVLFQVKEAAGSGDGRQGKGSGGGTVAPFL